MSELESSDCLLGLKVIHRFSCSCVFHCYLPVYYDVSFVDLMLLLPQSTIIEWTMPLLKSCEKYIDSVLSNESRDQSHDIPINEESFTKYLFTVGEICQVNNEASVYFGHNVFCFEN